MDIQTNKAGAVEFLRWIQARFGYQTGTVASAVEQYAAITSDGIVLKVKLPVGSANVLIVPVADPSGALRILLVQIKVLGLGFLVKQLRAMAAKAILAQLQPYSAFVQATVTDGNDILLAREGVFLTAVSYQSDLLTLSARL